MIKTFKRTFFFFSLFTQLFGQENREHSIAFGINNQGIPLSIKYDHYLAKYLFVSAGFGGREEFRFLSELHVKKSYLDIGVGLSLTQTGKRRFTGFFGLSNNIANLFDIRFGFDVPFYERPRYEMDFFGIFRQMSLSMVFPF